MIDIHSHILPSIDDGAKDLNKTLEMLSIASKNGIKKIVATPHLYMGYYENNYEDVCKLIEEVNLHKKEKGIEIEIFPGQEVFLDKHTLQFYKEGLIKGINNSRYVLVELPMQSMPKDALDILYELRVQGAKPIIAHPERYKYIIEKPSIINNFLDEKYLFQINSGSIKGLFGKRVQKTAETLIKHGICNFIASDAHSTRSRCPEIKTAVNIAESLNENLNLMKNASAVLKDEEIYITYEDIKEKRGIFSFFKNTLISKAHTIK